MSKRWITREEFAETTAAATDPDRLIREFLPQLRAHVAAKYSKMAERGSCILSVDDLIQVASIALMSLAERWEGIVAEHPEYRRDENGTCDAMFYAILKHEAKQQILNVFDRERRAYMVSLTVQQDGEEFERAALYDYTDGEMHDRTGVRRRPDGPWWPAVIDSIMAFWDVLAPKEKIALALRHYDALPGARVGTLSGTSDQYVRALEKAWRAHARNQVRIGDDDYEEVPRRKPQAWTPPEILETYLRDRHQMDLHEYLGIVTISFRTDPDYLAQILDSRKFIAPGQRDRITPEQIATIDSMAADGYNYAEIARAVGITSRTVGLRLDADRRDRERSRNLQRWDSAA